MKRTVPKIFPFPLMVTLILCTILTPNYMTQAQTRKVVVVSDKDEKPLSSTEQKAVIESIGKVLNEQYIFPEMAKKMEQQITANYKKGVYKKITSPGEFADILTKDLRAICKDKHLSVAHDPEIAQELANAETAGEDPDFLAMMMAEGKRANFGFKELKILDGNIGFLDLRGFFSAQLGGATAINAMNFLANSDALIIDLRYNGGGDPGMIQLISSYFFDELTHLNNFYNRVEDKTSQTWTLPFVQGQKMVDTPIFLLTSGNTFSAAEEFTYNLKNLERATVIGETTGGGAHPVKPASASHGFVLRVPFARAINPITNTNWEGTGVTPHIEAPAPQAFDIAYLKALKALAEKATNPMQKGQYEWAIAALEAAQNPVTLDENTLKMYAGKYGTRTLTLENDQLFYQREGRQKFKLLPLGKTLFALDGLEYFRLQIVQENGKVTGVKGLYDNGHTDFNERD